MARGRGASARRGGRGVQRDCRAFWRATCSPRRERARRGDAFLEPARRRVSTAAVKVLRASEQAALSRDGDGVTQCLGRRVRDDLCVRAPPRGTSPTDHALSTSAARVQPREGLTVGALGETEIDAGCDVGGAAPRAAVLNQCIVFIIQLFGASCLFCRQLPAPRGRAFVNATGLDSSVAERQIVDRTAARGASLARPPVTRLGLGSGRSTNTHVKQQR